jgi:glycosyltransferase involved in cell wall biosynthesis
MHVLIAGLSRFCAPSGLCRYTDMVGRSLSRSGDVQVSIALGSWQTGYFRHVFKTHQHSDIITIGGKNSPVDRNVWSLTFLPMLARKIGADLVHLAYPMPIQRQMFSCPVVVTVHDLYPFDLPSNFSLPFANKLMFKWCVSQTDAVVCVSRTTSQRLCEVLPGVDSARAVTQIYNPIPIPELSPEQSPVGGCHPSRFILTVGQHRRNKNLHVLLAGYALLRTTGAPWDSYVLVIVGSEGPETMALRVLTQDLGIQQHVLFLSSLSDSELAWLYRNCLVTVIPSSHEGLCMPLVEAVCSGARVVSSDIPVLRELKLPVAGYWECEGGSSQTLAATIATAVTVERPSRAPANPCDPSSVTRQFIALYQETLSGGRVALRASPA